MPYALTATGVTVATQAELVAFYTAAFQQIYGANINLGSNTPDGQMMNIVIQQQLDIGDLLLAIYNSFNPDAAFGVTLDQRLAINGVQRQAGTFTVTPVTITCTQSVNLYGLDQSAQPVYTVADNAGNQWQLQVTQLGVAAGAHVLNFQAAAAGAVLTVPNTITVPVTIVLGVSAINNPTLYTTLGVNEESDAAAKIRRQKSVSLPAQGFTDSLEAALENLSGVTSAVVYENDTSITDSNGIPANSIWAVVGGSGAAVDIADAIYTYRSEGCGTFGSVSYTLTQLDGSAFTVTWDALVSQNVFVKLTASSINGTAAPSLAAIQAQLPALFQPGAHAAVDINQLATFVQQVDPNCLVTGAGYASGQTQTLLFSDAAASGSFVLNYNGVATAAINWNDSIATVQTKVQAVAGLSAVIVTGGLWWTFDLSSVPSVQGLLTATANTLATAGAVPVTISNTTTIAAATLVPSSLKNQFQITSANVILLPMLLTAGGASAVTHGTTTTLTGLGGYGALTYSFQTNASGGSVNATTGAYTAGGATGVADVLKVADAIGNSATLSLTVV